jgi:hypothetical protein
LLFESRERRSNGASFSCSDDSLFQCPAGRGYTRLAEGLTESVYIDENGLDINNRYYYRVRAENTAEYLSNFSNEVSAFPQFSPVPPGGIGAAGGGDSKRLGELSGECGFAQADDGYHLLR